MSWTAGSTKRWVGEAKNMSIKVWFITAHNNRLSYSLSSGPSGLRTSSNWKYNLESLLPIKLLQKVSNHHNLHNLRYNHKSNSLGGRAILLCTKRYTKVNNNESLTSRDQPKQLQLPQKSSFKWIKHRRNHRFRMTLLNLYIFIDIKHSPFDQLKLYVKPCSLIL